MIALKALANLLYPPACLLCRVSLSVPRDAVQTSDVLCETCLGRMPRSDVPACSRCSAGVPGAFDADMLCASCRTNPPAFEAAAAPWRYAGCARQAVQAFKYHRRRRLGSWLAEQMAQTARTALPLSAVTAIVPVPLHWLTQRLRGFHAAGHLAAGVAAVLERPSLSRALRQHRWTATQTRLPWEARFRNVRGAFCAKEAPIRGHTVLLVDDVLTSGATADACTQALKDAGAASVYVLTAARTPPP